MARKYTPATFQPTIRPDWAGILSYIPDSEKIQIFEAILKYPSIELESKFWIETIEPELKLQYESFISACNEKSRAIRNRWGKQKGIDIYNISITDVEDKNNICNTCVIVPERESKSKSEERSRKEEKKEKENKGGVGEKEGKEEMFSQSVIEFAETGANYDDLTPEDKQIVNNPDDVSNCHRF